MASDQVQGVFFNGETGVRFMSNTTGYVVDLLCEGEIDGPVWREWKDNGSNQEGSIGFTKGVTIDSYSLYQPSGELASIYWNKTPVYDKESEKFNYGAVDLVTNQQTISQEGLSSRRLVQINEKLRGLERKTGSTIEFTKYHRYYTIRNKYCNKAIINFKIGSLGNIDRDPGTASNPNETYGKLRDSDVSVKVDFRAKYALGSKAQYETGGIVKIEGSLSSPYARSFELDLPLEKARNLEGRGDFIGWEIRVFKDKEEPTTPDTRNEIFIDNIVEEIQDSFIYPKSYVVKNTFDAQNFASIPERAYDMRLMKVKIPKNYDPITRTYRGSWNGEFSTEAVGEYGDLNGSAIGTRTEKDKHWTDNPAWCFYDLITNKRYGLGKYVDTSTLDKWSLYEIAQYCDELVEDFDGGLEPRFSCNIIIQSREDAYQVLNDMASIFRGIVYYNGGNLFAVQDSLKDPIFQFNNTSVENGEFKYSSTSAKVRHTVAIVRYNDKNNKFEPAVEYVEDVDSIRKYGIKEKEISAFGCTSKSQAQRLGRWILATESNETETVSFTCGQEGAILRPGDVFSVSDSNRSMTRRGGRIKALERTSDSTFKIALDSQLKGGKSWDGNNFVSNDNLDGKIEYQLTVSTPSFYYDTSQVDLGNSTETNLMRNKQIQTFDISPNTVSYDTNSGVSVITVSGNLDETAYTTSGFDGESLWSIATTGVNDKADTFFETLRQQQEYRVINISESDKGKYEISAAEYARVKYGEIDKATKPVNNVTFQVPAAPSLITLTQRQLTAEGAPNTKIVEIGLGESPDHASSVSYYQVYIKKGSASSETDFDSSAKIYSLNELTSDFIPASDGEYYVSAYAYNVLGQSNGTSATVVSINVNNIAPIRDIAITHLSLIDDAAGGANPNESDPTTVGQVDFFTDSTARLKWKTSVPQFKGANIALDFQYKVEVYDDHGPSNVIRTVNNYKPDDSEGSITTFNYTLANNFADHSNNYDLIKRALSFKVFAMNEAGETSAPDHDVLKIENPQPSVPSFVSSDGFIDLDNHIKIFNLNRPPDVKEVVILTAESSFSYSDYTEGSRTDIEAKRISADVDVFEINPTWSTQSVTNENISAYFMVAYVDQFDLDIESLAVANGETTFDLTKRLTNRFSQAVKIDKVTQDTLDLLGEGWKAWIQIDVDGNWYGRGIKCVEDITNDASEAGGGTDYKGYLQFYCTRKAPIIGFDAVGDPTVGSHKTTTVPQTITHGGAFTMSCNYYTPQGGGSNEQYDSDLPTAQIDLIGGHDSSTTTIAKTNNDDTWSTAMQGTKGFKRFKVHLEKQRSNPYWVMGMNANNEKYYSDTLLENLNTFFTPSNITPQWAEDMKAGATDALAKAEEDQANVGKVQIGSSDGYFNFHPAGFVQGFGGLPKKSDHFVIHMGHMIDKSYLSRAIFFVMGTTEETSTRNNTTTPSCT